MATELEVTTQAQPAEVECDRCGGDHESTSCPYFKKERDPKTGYDRDGNKLPSQIAYKRKEAEKKFWKKCTNHSKMIFAICGIILLAFYLYYAAYGCGGIENIAKLRNLVCVLMEIQ